MQLHNFFHWSLLSIEINYCQLLLLLPRDFLQPLHQPLLYSYSKPVLTSVLECCHLVWLCCITSSILNYFSDLKFSPHWEHSSNGNHGNELWPKKKKIISCGPTPFPWTDFDIFHMAHPMIILKLLPKFQAPRCSLTSYGCPWQTDTYTHLPYFII